MNWQKWLSKEIKPVGTPLEIAIASCWLVGMITFATLIYRNEISGDKNGANRR